jgi:uncharacterized surface protein with fasciclin (FAS1) repeats
MRHLVAAIAVAAASAGSFVAPAFAQGKPGANTIWQIVESSPDHTLLQIAIDAAGLRGALDNPDVRYTLFAPTDAAFEKVADELYAAGIIDQADFLTLATFLVENELLDDVLFYHVTEGRRYANSIVPRKGEKAIPTLLETYFVAKVGALLTDASGATTDAMVTTPNISASNGVVHVIDNVLVPLS